MKSERVTVRISKSDWEAMGRKAGWAEDFGEDAEDVLGGDLDEHMDGKDFVGELQGFNCPQCGERGEMSNATAPMVYDCTFCDIMWNPDNLPAFSKGSRGDRPSLKKIWEGQSKMYTEEKAQTMLEDFIYKALKAGYEKDRIVKGLEVFYRQHVSSGDGIYERAIAKL